MRLLKPLLVLPVLALTLPACDYIDGASPTDGGGNGGPIVDVEVPRKVLLEDLTGHRCNNCPDAALIAQQLVGVYGDQLVLVGEHMVDVFAAPGLPLGDDSLDTDFRTPAGEAYRTTFDITSLPKGLINRNPHNGGVGRANWSTAVAGYMGQEADYKIWFEDFAFNSGTNTVSTTVKVLVTRNVTGDHNLTLYLTEDHVIDGQIDQTAHPSYVPNYDHRHVLRSALNSPWGEVLITGSATAGDTLTRTYSYPLPANVRTPANCALVAYVYSTQGADQYEVKQVEEHKFQ